MNVIYSMINQYQSMPVLWQITFWVWLISAITAITWWWADTRQNFRAIRQEHREEQDH